MMKLCLDHAVKPATLLISILNNIHSSAPLVFLDRDTQILGKWDKESEPVLLAWQSNWLQ